MTKGRHWLCIAALALALAAPAAWAEDSVGVASWFEEIVAQVIAVMGGDDLPSPAAAQPDSQDEPELGEYVPVNG